MTWFFISRPLSSPSQFYANKPALHVQIHDIQAVLSALLATNLNSHSHLIPLQKTCVCAFGHTFKSLQMHDYTCILFILLDHFVLFCSHCETMQVHRIFDIKFSHNPHMETYSNNIAKNFSMSLKSENRHQV